VLRQRGIEHERRLLAKLEAEGKRVVRFEPLPKWESWEKRFCTPRQ
jgi:hypothetical protein